MRLFPNRLRRRLTLWYTLSLSLIFLLFFGGLFTLMCVSCLYPIRAQLNKEIRIVEHTALTALARMPLLEAQGPIPAFRVMENSRAVYASRAWLNARLPAGIYAGPDDFHGIESDSGRHFYLRESTVSDAGRTLHISVAQDIEQAYDSLRKLALALLIGFPVVVLLSLAGGYWFAGRMLSPLRAMAHTAQKITADKLSERLPVLDVDDEFGHLAAIFNDTFGRLEASFERMRRFTADASHELRTPLTVIRSVGENALRHDQDSTRHADSIGSMLEETDRLVRLLDDLLILTRAESGKLPLQIEELDIADLALDVLNCLRVLAEEKQQDLHLHVDQPVRARGDRATIRQALINLLANAIRYTPEQGRIELRTGCMADGRWMIEVCDNGPGIAAEHHLKIFERFYRIDAGRSRETGGAGLGLAIARWAIELNGGGIELESKENCGSIFRIILPASPSHHPTF